MNKEQEILKKANEEQPKENKIKENEIFVGGKETMRYVLAAMTQLSDGIKEIKIKARGKSINRAVDVAEIVKNRFKKSMTSHIETTTERYTGNNGKEMNVSTICITLTKEG